jgi:hypothetical protein
MLKKISHLKVKDQNEIKTLKNKIKFAEIKYKSV